MKWKDDSSPLPKTQEPQSLGLRLLERTSAKTKDFYLNLSQAACAANGSCWYSAQRLPFFFSGYEMTQNCAASYTPRLHATRVIQPIGPEDRIVVVHFVKWSHPRYISHLTNWLPISRVVQVFQVIVGLIKTSNESSHVDGSQTEWHATYFSFNNMGPQELLTQVYCSEPQSTELPLNKKVAKRRKDVERLQTSASPSCSAWVPEYQVTRIGCQQNCTLKTSNNSVPWWRDVDFHESVKAN